MKQAVDCAALVASGDNEHVRFRCERVDFVFCFYRIKKDFAVSREFVESGASADCAENNDTAFSFA